MKAGLLKNGLARLGGAFLIAATALAGAGAQQKAQAASTLVFCSEGNPDNLAPALARTNTSFDAILHAYDTDRKSVV